MKIRLQLIPPLEATLPAEETAERTPLRVILNDMYYLLPDILAASSAQHIPADTVVEIEPTNLTSDPHLLHGHVFTVIVVFSAEYLAAHAESARRIKHDVENFARGLIATESSRLHIDPVPSLEILIKTFDPREINNRSPMEH